jgi:hypothetical protein
MQVPVHVQGSLLEKDRLNIITETLTTVMNVVVSDYSGSELTAMQSV